MLKILTKVKVSKTYTGLINMEHRFTKRPRMNEALFNLGFDEAVKTSSKNMLINRGKKESQENKTSK